MNHYDRRPPYARGLWAVAWGAVYVMDLCQFFWGGLRHRVVIARLSRTDLFE